MNLLDAGYTYNIRSNDRRTISTNFDCRHSGDRGPRLVANSRKFQEDCSGKIDYHNSMYIFFLYSCFAVAEFFHFFLKIIVLRASAMLFVLDEMLTYIAPIRHTFVYSKSKKFGRLRGYIWGRKPSNKTPTRRGENAFFVGIPKMVQCRCEHPECGQRKVECFPILWDHRGVCGAGFFFLLLTCH